MNLKHWTLKINNMENQTQEMPCKNGHVVQGRVPSVHDDFFHDKVCDCGHLKYFKEDCSCPTGPGWKIASKPNNQ